jgi:hypothetical protein
MSSCVHKKLQFTYLDYYSYESKLEKVGSTYVYLVKGYKSNKRCEAQIDNFVCNIKEQIEDNLHNVSSIDIYEETDKTNPECLRLHRTYFSRGDFLKNDSCSIDEDILWSYEFKDKKFKQKSTIPKYRKYKFHYPTPDCLVQ